MGDQASATVARIQRLLHQRVKPAIYRDRVALDVSAYEVDGEPVAFSVARSADYAPFSIGQWWGRPWGTVWFHVEGVVPEGWTDSHTRPELVAALSQFHDGPGFQAEGLVWTPAGDIVKALEPLNSYAPVGGPGSIVDLYIEAAANPNIARDFTFAPTPYGDRATAPADHLYQLTTLELGQLDEVVWNLAQDIEALLGLVGTVPQDGSRRAEILAALDRMADVVDARDVAGTAGLGRTALADVLASPANASAHRVIAVGHAHIDSAWLWPVRETVRKVARTFSNVIELAQHSPGFVFAASSAQQYSWLKDAYPALFARVAEQIRRGTFVPIGGMWVESDTNMPGGESLVRQFVFGKRFFLDEFGVEPREVWLPDSFGYTAAMPQIVRLAGSSWFFTQKISWNDTNTMPHHTFLWEGIDGSRVFTHFPPVDTYNAELSATELARAERQYADKGVGTVSLVPFGWGDGGGGPTREMIAAAARTRDLEGSPRVELGSPARFFEAAEAEMPNPAVWSGEMYLELHRGTYTSQARIKQGNRRSEQLLREAELWATTANVELGVDYPYDELAECWRTVLLQQFHDILPGSAIAWVVHEAEARYREIADALARTIDRSLASLTGDGDAQVVVNASPFDRAGVEPGGAALRGRAAHGARGATAEGNGAAVDAVRQAAGQFVLENARVRFAVDARGRIVSAIEKATGRDAFKLGHPGNVPQLFRDTPTVWDAWDIDASYARAGIDLGDAVTVSVEAAGAVRILRTFGDSTFEQTLTLDDELDALDIATTVDWHERERLLKLAFPVDVLAETAASEIQFGHVRRSTNVNTSWDQARFETVAHRWVSVSDEHFGVSLANDSTYGHDIRRLSFDDETRGTLIRASLLRAPLFPDPESDQGRHEFRFSLKITGGVPGAIENGYRLHHASRARSGGHGFAPIVRVDGRGVVLETVKLADDRSGDVILRLYESLGGRTGGLITPGFDWEGAHEVDLLEREMAPRAGVHGDRGGIALELGPFQIATVRVRRSRA